MSHFNNALQLVEELTVEELQKLNRDQLLFIASGLTKAEVSDFMFAKNMKIFGGINGYVDDFLSSGTIIKIKDMAEGLSKITIRDGALQTLNKMLTYKSLTDTNRVKINNAVAELQYASAPAAGGLRKKKSRTRKHKGKNKK